MIISNVAKVLIDNQANVNDLFFDDYGNYWQVKSDDQNHLYLEEFNRVKSIEYKAIISYRTSILIVLPGLRKYESTQR